MVLYNIIRLRLRALAGQIANLAGLPCFVRECDYEAGVTNALIRVRAGTMFTVITVNGLDIYFHRLTGKIDGVGLTAGCMQSETLSEVPSLAQRDSPHLTSHK